MADGNQPAAPLAWRVLAAVLLTVLIASTLVNRRVNHASSVAAQQQRSYSVAAVAAVRVPVPAAARPSAVASTSPPTPSSPAAADVSAEPSVTVLSAMAPTPSASNPALTVTPTTTPANNAAVLATPLTVVSFTDGREQPASRLRDELLKHNTALRVLSAGTSFCAEKPAVLVISALAARDAAAVLAQLARTLAAPGEHACTAELWLVLVVPLAACADGAATLLGRVRDEHTRVTRLLVLRAAQVLGNDDDDDDDDGNAAENSVPWLVRKALAHQPLPAFENDKHTLVPLVHVADVARAVVWAVAQLARTTETPLPSCVDVVSEPVLTRRQVVQHVVALTRSASPTVHLPVSQSSHTATATEPQQRFRGAQLGTPDALSAFVAELRRSALAYLANADRQHCRTLTAMEVSLWHAGISNCTGMLVMGDVTADSNALWLSVAQDTDQVSWSVPDGYKKAQVHSTTFVADGGQFYFVMDAKTKMRRYVCRGNGTAIVPLATPDAAQCLWGLDLDPVSRKIAILGADQALANQRGPLVLQKTIVHDFRLAPPVNDRFERRECLAYYSSDVATDTMRVLPNPVPVSAQYPHPARECRQIAAASDKLVSDLADNTTLGLRHVRAATADPTAWALHALPVCANDCAYPLVCIDTGNCRCVHAHCMRRLQPGAATHASSWTRQDLIRAVDGIAVADVLLPGVRRLWSGRQHLWPRMVVHDYRSVVNPLLQPVYKQMPMYGDCVGTVSDQYSYSWDHLWLRTMLAVPGHTATNSTRDTAVLNVVPFYHGCFEHHMHLRSSQLLNTIFANATRAFNASERLLFAMSHDNGACVDYSFTARGMSRQQHRTLINTTVVQCMGDWQTNCILAHKDVVVPARPAASYRMWKSLGALAMVNPMAARKIFVFYRGTAWGAGAVVRNRVASLAADIFPTQWQHTKTKKSESVYVGGLMHSRFCVSPAGVAGWSYRLSEAIFAGCLPVITHNATVLPFFDLIDYSQFAVFVTESAIFDLERVLLGLSLDQMQRMQTKMLRIRGMFMWGFPSSKQEAARISASVRAGDAPGANNISPSEMAWMNLAVRQMTTFPVDRSF